MEQNTFSICPQVCEEEERQKVDNMTAIHTESTAIFWGMNVNEAELKIKYVKFRPSQPYNSKSPITFTILGNTTPYVSLRDLYLFVQCQVEETDQYSSGLLSFTHGKRSLNDDDDNYPPYK